MTGTEREVRIALRDGVELAATLYLPEATEPQPCLLEALPYRKDDLTSGYADSYLRFRDEFGYAVCRVDVRGTGSSSGDAHDEYPTEEQPDLVEVIGWLAAQPWCDGNVGMWGTSYSGFNSLQVACERPPALKAVCAIYSSDDRWTDDVHWRGGALRLLDLVDYCHYMTPMAMLPPVPAVWGEGWHDEWLRRLRDLEPWALTWLREHRDGPYWRHGSVRDAQGNGYDRIGAAVLLVAGWADGYRNNTFRTIEALGRAGVPHRLIAGPWVHADPTTAYPAPRIDLDLEMAAWWDRWLRGGGAQDDALDIVDVFVRTSTRPASYLEEHEGYWLRDTWPSAATAWTSRGWESPRMLQVEPDVGVAAWIDCAGHLPWGLSDDQRFDDARSLRYDWTADEETIVGQPRLRVRVSVDAPLASISVKLCDVFPDGASALVARGSLDLTYRDGVHGPPALLEPGVEYDVVVDLDACAYAWQPGNTLRLSIAGADWPNTVAPPGPVALTVHGGTLELPTHVGSAVTPAFTPGAEVSSESADGVTWTTTRDVLRGTTTCTTRYGGTYAVPHDGTASEDYAGEVTVDTQTFAQHAQADCTYRLTWPGIDITTQASMRVDVTATGYDVTVSASARDSDQQVFGKTWSEHIPR